MKKDRSRSTALDKAEHELKILTANVLYWVILFVLVAFWLALIPAMLTTASGSVPNPVFEILVAIITLSAAAIAVYIARTGTYLAVLQMRQAEEYRRSADATDLALANVIGELTKELRRRPDISPSVVTFSLFGPSSLIRPAGKPFR
jgi:hypothetical protein